MQKNEYAKNILHIFVVYKPKIERDMKKSLLFILALAMFSCTGFPGFEPSQNEDPDDSGQVETPEVPSFERVSTTTNWVQHSTGNLPIIISAPHGSTKDGGTVNGESLVKRTSSNLNPNSDGCDFRTGQDANTLTLAQYIDSAIYKKTGKHPHLVIARMHRRYIDFNRHKECAIPFVNGAYVTPNETSWDTYHEILDNISKEITEQFGSGLLIDIHAHGHSVAQVEIGYTLSKSQLAKTNEELMADEKYAQKSSIYALSQRNKNNLSFAELLRGEFSFGDYLYNAGLKCVPRSTKLDPGDETYFSGGYISKSQGSALEYGGTIDAIQLEFHSGSKSDLEKRKATADKVATAIIEYMKKHYYLDVFDNFDSTQDDDKTDDTPTDTPSDNPDDPSYDRVKTNLNYVDYINGNLPIILSAPHGSLTEGGTVNGESLVKRKESNLSPEAKECSCSFVTTQDKRTMSLARHIDTVIYELTGRHPYMVLAQQARTYVDFNRHKVCAIPYVNGAYVTPNETSWNTYHEFLTLASDKVTEQFGSGLLIDIHGHGHDVQQVEIGYTLTKTTLAKTDEELMAEDAAKNSSIYALSQRNKNNLSFTELLRGESSFGDYLYNEGLACVPRSGKLCPPADETYFNGGYISKSQGSALEYGGTVDAIQLEFGSDARQTENLRETAEAVAQALLNYMRKHYHLDVLND